VFGDLTGDGVYDREARTLVKQLQGVQLADPRYMAALDANSDGLIDAVDDRIAVRNWGKSVAAVSPPVATPPKVAGTVVNDGAAQRSMVKSVRVSFDAVVSIDLAGVTLTDSTGRAAPFGGGTTTYANGTTLFSLLPVGVGSTVADGRYTLTIKAGAVKTSTGGTAMAVDYTFGFTRLFGDLNGDGVYDREARTLVKQLQGITARDPRFVAALDSNADGVIDATDELAAVRNWGKVVS
jgi:hypothetical protein